MFKINNQKLKFSLYFDKYKNSEISTIEIEIIYAICKEFVKNILDSESKN